VVAYDHWRAVVRQACFAICHPRKAAQRKWKVPTSITIAQWIMESGSAKRMSSHSNSPFGIKAVRGKQFVMALFRVFAFMDDAFDPVEPIDAF
jgi:flagellum-specific peptidoglycan hydrolase FlgJ